MSVAEGLEHHYAARAARLRSTREHLEEPGSIVEIGRPWRGSLPAQQKTAAVVGLGYVGLPTALALASAGWKVVGIDVSSERLADIESCAIDANHRGADWLAEALSTEQLTLAGDPSRSAGADAVLICVPTPVDEHRVPDLRALTSACAAAVASARPGQLIALTSTSYVGTTRDLLIGPLAERGLVAGEDVHVAFCPERIDPGNPEHAGMSVPRVVGGATPACAEHAVHLMKSIAAEVHVVSSPEAAEMTKLLENTYRAVNIAFVNEVADVCATLDLDVREVINAAATKPYGFVPFRPGPGVGGHCIPCDPHYLLWQLRRERVECPVIESSMTAIARRPGRVVDRLAGLLSEQGHGLRGTKVVVIGVAYKPHVDDVRESPALEIIDELLDKGACVSYVDPRVAAIRLRNGGIMTGSSMGAITESSVVVLHTVHDGLDISAVGRASLVLDATYRPAGGSNWHLM